MTGRDEGSRHDRPARAGDAPARPRRRPRSAAAVAGVALILAGCGDPPVAPTGDEDSIPEADLDLRLQAYLSARDFTGRIEERLEARLGRPIDTGLAEVGRLLFFDPVLSLTGDNSCAGCHGPNESFNGAKSIAIGVANNGVVGPGRTGPHNFRRAPTLINVAFYPRLMWDLRFRSEALDAFDNTEGFAFPEPEGTSLSHMEHLLGAQAFTPVVSRVEMAGFAFQGDHGAMRDEVVRRVDAIAEYRTLFGSVYPAIASGAPIAYEHVAAALAEFTFTLVRADAPLDRYARGDLDAMSPDEKRGAILFYGPRAACFECHIGEGYASEMFSDFDAHVLAVPQVVPLNTNVTFDGPAANEDFGLERTTGDPLDRYKFRTSPLRNAAYQPSFMHNGAFLCLEDAIRHHTDVYASLARYTTDALDPSLHGPLGPTGPMLDRVHHLSGATRELSEEEVRQIIAFVRYSLTDPDAHPERLRSLVPVAVPSGLALHRFEFTPRTGDCV